MRRNAIRRAALATSIVALAIGALVPAHAATVSGSTLMSSTGANCYFSTDCAPFIATCNPSFALKDGVLASVVDISGLRGPDRKFKWTGTLWGSESTAKAAVDLLDSACRNVGGVPQNPGVAIDKQKVIDVPSSAKWLVFVPGAAALTSWTMST